MTRRLPDKLAPALRIEPPVGFHDAYLIWQLAARNADVRAIFSRRCWGHRPQWSQTVLQTWD